MAGIGNYSKGKKFALKSGNKPAFKMMGSSPYKDNKDPESGKKSTASTVLETAKESEKKAREVLDPVGAAMGLGTKVLKTAGEAISKIPISFGTTKRDA